MSQQYPTPDFQVLVSTFATQAAMGLGQMPNPMTNKAEVDLKAAKFAIDLLQLLDEKTQGNRTEDEDKFLQDCLYQFRMLYIDKSASK
jgi:hypothetical protein